MSENTINSAHAEQPYTLPPPNYEDMAVVERPYTPIEAMLPEEFVARAITIVVHIGSDPKTGERTLRAASQEDAQEMVLAALSIAHFLQKSGTPKEQAQETAQAILQEFLQNNMDRLSKEAPVISSILPNGCPIVVLDERIMLEWEREELLRQSYFRYVNRLQAFGHDLDTEVIQALEIERTTGYALSAKMLQKWQDQQLYPGGLAQETQEPEDETENERKNPKYESFEIADVLAESQDQDSQPENTQQAQQGQEEGAQASEEFEEFVALTMPIEQHPAYKSLNDPSVSVNPRRPNAGFFQNEELAEFLEFDKSQRALSLQRMQQAQQKQHEQ